MSYTCLGFDLIEQEYNTYILYSFEELFLKIKVKIYYFKNKHYTYRVTIDNFQLENQRLLTLNQVIEEIENKYVEHRKNKIKLDDFVMRRIKATILK